MVPNYDRSSNNILLGILTSSTVTKSYIEADCLHVILVTVCWSHMTVVEVEQ